MTRITRIALLTLTLTPLAAEAGACSHVDGAGRARCLAVEADRLIAQSDRRVAEAARRMQGLDRQNLRAFQAWLDRNQREWRERVEGECIAVERRHPDDPAAGPACRARAAQGRNAEIDRYLSGTGLPD